MLLTGWNRTQVWIFQLPKLGWRFGFYHINAFYLFCYNDLLFGWGLSCFLITEEWPSGDEELETGFFNVFYYLSYEDGLVGIVAYGKAWQAQAKQNFLQTVAKIVKGLVFM